jgi:hypothetical protein
MTKIQNHIIIIIIIIIIQWSIPGEGFSIPIYRTNSYIKIPIYSVYLKSICLWDQKYNYICIIYLKSIKSIISGNVINCCLASSALTQF